MKKIAVFGNAGGGKSTLSRELAKKLDMPLFALDQIKYKSGGGEVPHDEYLRQHSEIVSRKTWIIDGFGCAKSAWERFDLADTLVLVDLALPVHYWQVTKRFLVSGVVPPEGWPENSPMIRGTWNSYAVLWACHLKLTPRYRQLIREQSGLKACHHLRSRTEIRDFLDSM